MYQYHFVFSGIGPGPKHGQGTADPFGTLAVIAAVCLGRARGVSLQTPGIQGSGNISGTMQCFVKGLGEFVLAQAKIHLAMAVYGSGYPIAIAVDIDDLACL